MAPAGVLRLLLMLATLLASSTAFPMRFVNALASEAQSVSVRIISGNRSEACIADFGAECDIGTFASLTGATIIATDARGAMLISLSDAWNEVLTHSVASHCCGLLCSIFGSLACGGLSELSNILIFCCAD